MGKKTYIRSLLFNSVLLQAKLVEWTSCTIFSGGSSERMLEQIYMTCILSGSASISIAFTNPAARNQTT